MKILVFVEHDIIIEGALHGKLVLCFLPDEDDKTSHFSLALPLTHFEDFLREPSFLFVRGEKSLVPSVRSLLAKVGDAESARAQQVACSHFVTSFDQPYGERLVRFLEDTVSVSTERTSRPRNG